MILIIVDEEKKLIFLGTWNLKCLLRKKKVYYYYASDKHMLMISTARIIEVLADKLLAMDRHSILTVVLDYIIYFQSRHDFVRTVRLTFNKVKRIELDLWISRTESTFPPTPPPPPPPPPPSPPPPAAAATAARHSIQQPTPSKKSETFLYRSHAAMSNVVKIPLQHPINYLTFPQRAPLPFRDTVSNQKPAGEILLIAPSIISIQCDLQRAGDARIAAFVPEEKSRYELDSTAEYPYVPRHTSEAKLLIVITYTPKRKVTKNNGDYEWNLLFDCSSYSNKGRDKSENIVSPRVSRNLILDWHQFELTQLVKLRQEFLFELAEEELTVDYRKLLQKEHQMTHAAGPPVQLEPVDLSVKTPVVLQVPRYSPAAIITAAARRIPSPSTTPTPPPLSISTVNDYLTLPNEMCKNKGERQLYNAKRPHQQPVDPIPMVRCRYPDISCVYTFLEDRNLKGRIPGQLQILLYGTDLPDTTLLVLTCHFETMKTIV
ncbi:hypothetical protein WN51_01340 [Melipona quadrifasciata]|uniref:Uncharacterized protein n=1 Tax=Melipona quadrifasciata TaxID=166423 RepID=A0A0N0BFE8_9HYME|nr:hypothetical protein WN51_01340 [Melipona quadrifasciata]